MPTFIAGKDNKVLFGAFYLSSYFNSANFSREQETVETTTFGSDQATFISSVETASATLGGFFDGSTDAVDEELEGMRNRDAAGKLENFVKLPEQIEYLPKPATVSKELWQNMEWKLLVFALQNTQHAGKVGELRMHLLATGVIEEEAVDALFSRYGKRKMAEELQKMGVTEAQSEQSESKRQKTAEKADEDAPEKAPEPHASETTSPPYIGAASLSGIETGSPVQACARRKNVAL